MTQAACDRSDRQKDFATVEDATQALVAAVQAEDTSALLQVLGSDSKPVVDSGDPVQDENARRRFLSAYEAAHKLATTANGEVTLEVGKDGWPFPFPLIQREGRWRFDSSAGVEEIVNRRIGANELATIQSCLAFVDAEREYYVRNPQGLPLLQFAQKLISTAGRKDGLYWPTSGNEPESPLGERFAHARSEGYFEGKSQPLRGYVYRLLTSQGPDAAGGAYDYLVGESLLGGFALLALPAQYGNSGVMTFIVNHDGVVFSKDLGAQTAQAAAAIQSFNPDRSWQREAAIEAR